MNNIIKKSFFAFLIKIVGAISGLIMTTLVARNLQLESSGIFFLCFSTLTVLSIFCNRGMHITYVRFISKLQSKDEWSKINSIFTKGLYSVLKVVIITSLIFFFSSNYVSLFVFNNFDNSIIIKIFSLCIPFFTISKLIGYALQGLDKTSSTVFLQNINIPIFFATIFVIGNIQGIDNNLYVFSIYFFIANLMNFFVSVFLWFTVKRSSIKIDNSEDVSFMTASQPLWVLSSLTILIEFSGEILTGIFSTPSEVSFFAVANRIAMVISIVLIAINLVAAPRFAKHFYNNNLKEMRKIFYLCSKIMICVSFPVLIGIVLYSSEIMGFFGSEYVKGVIVLKILIIGQFVNVACGSVGFILNMTGHEKDMRDISVFTLIIALTSGIILIKNYGSLGAAISTSVAISSQNLIACYFVKKRLGFNPLKFWSNQ